MSSSPRSNFEPVDVAQASKSQRLKGLIRACRPSQWVKNLTCFAGLIFSRKLFDPTSLVEAILAFLGFSLAASAVYLLNDVVDRPFDRENPDKRGRPIASGLVPASSALLFASVLASTALSTTLFLNAISLSILSLYMLLNVAYTFKLKHTVLLDVGVIAFGFVLRVLHGVYAVEVKPTSWIVLCMFFLALFLGFSKRRGEMGQMGEGEPFRRPVLAKYETSFLDMILVMTATMSIVCYALYTVNGYQGNATLVVTVPLVTYGIIRYMLLVMVHGAGEAPDRLLVSDPVLLGTGALWVVSCVLIIYLNLRIFLS